MSIDELTAGNALLDMIRERKTDAIVGYPPSDDGNMILTCGMTHDMWNLLRRPPRVFNVHVEIYPNWPGVMFMFRWTKEKPLQPK